MDIFHTFSKIYFENFEVQNAKERYSLSPPLSLSSSLSHSFSLYLLLSLTLSLSILISLSLSLSLSPSLSLSLYLSIYLSLFLSVYLSISSSLTLSFALARRFMCNPIIISSLINLPLKCVWKLFERFAQTVFVLSVKITSKQTIPRVARK